MDVIIKEHINEKNVMKKPLKNDKVFKELEKEKWNGKVREVNET